MKRVLIGSEVLRSLHAYYRDRTCVVSGEAVGTDWHHLDDDSGNSVFHNLVPLCRDLNLRLYQYSRQRINKEPLRLDPVLDPATLSAIADRWLLTGYPWRAVGAARLAVFIAQRYLCLDSSRVLLLCAYCLHHLRHKFSDEIVVDLLERNVLASLEEQRTHISVSARWRLLFELGSLLQEFGRIPESSQIYQDCLAIRPLALTREDQHFASALLRLEGLNCARLGLRRRAWDYVRRAKDEIPDLARSMNNYLSTEAKMSFEDGNVEGAIEQYSLLRKRLVDAAGQPLAFSSTHRSLASTLLHYSVAVVKSGARRRYEAARQTALDAVRILDACGAGMKPMFTSDMPVGMTIDALRLTLDLPDLMIAIYPRSLSRRLEQLVRVVCKRLGVTS